MTNRMWKISGGLIIVFLLLGFVNFKIATGYVLGAAAAILLFYRNHTFWSDVLDANLDTNNVKKTTGFLHFAINYAIMGAVLILSAKLPQYLNIFACAAGLFIIKWTAYIDAFLAMRGEKDDNSK